MHTLMTIGIAAITTPAFAQDGDIVAVASANEDFETLVAAVQAAELVETLQGEGPFTVFAPNDAAFEALDEGVVEGLLKPEAKADLTAVLTYHVVSGKILAADVAAGSVETVQGDTLDITVGEDGTVMVDGAKVVATDVMATNGVIHVIDAVVMPTVEEPPPPEPDPTLVSVAAGNPDFSTLVSAIEAAGLVDTLSGEGPFTVFAPTNDAFAKVDPDALADLLKPENKDQLVAVLTYHVLPGKVMAADVSSGKVATAQGDTVKIKAKKGTVRVNKATVTATDIEAPNGVIHVIDTVLMP
ncbi:MAG: fasciclin domain-containing protein [Myxococcales bacterium]|nr:fasciclin domain-containing protein [Myxococcales bacterium]